MAIKRPRDDRAAAAGPQPSGGRRAPAFLPGDAKPGPPGGGKKPAPAVADQRSRRKPLPRPDRAIRGGMGVPADGPQGEVAARAPAPREPAAPSVQRPVPRGAKATETSSGTEQRGFGHRRCNGSPLRHPDEVSGPTPSPRFGCGAVAPPKIVVQGWSIEVRQHVMSRSISPRRSTPSVGGRRPAVHGARVVEAIRERSAPWLGRQRRPSSNEDPRAVEYSDGAAGDRDERHARPGGSRPPWAVEHSDGAAGNRPVWPRPGRTAWMREGSSPKGRDSAGGSVEPGAPGRLAQ